MLMAIVLSFLAVTTYSALTGKGCMAPPPPKDETTETGTNPDGPSSAKGAEPAKPKDGGPAPAPAPAPSPEDPKGDEPAPSPDAPHPQVDVASSRITLESDELKVTFTSQGGAIESVQHKRAFESDGSTPFDQVVPMNPVKLMGQIDDVGVPPEARIDAPGGADRRIMPYGPMRDPRYQWTREDTGKADEAVFTFRTRDGRTWRKRWSLAQGEHRYDIHLDLSVSGGNGMVPIKLLAASGQLREHVQGAFAMPSGVIYRLSSVAEISDTLQWGLDLQRLELEGRSTPHLSVFGTKSPFFITLYYAEKDADKRPAVTSFWATGEHGDRGAIELELERWYKDQRGVDLDAQGDIDDRLTAGVKEFNHCWLGVEMTPDTKPSTFSFYVGPIERSTLGQDVYSPLASVVTYPNAPDFVADILLGIYDFWRNLLGSAGLAVILMTLVVRGAMMPLSVRNQLSMRRYGRKVAKLKPKVKQLQEKYAKNPKKLRDEQMKLYRENGVGFPSGCLMMLVQIPIFFALFSSLRVEYSIRGAEFLWIKDLSGPDKLIDFGTKLVDFGPMFYLDAINILPLLMVVLSILHTRNMPKPADEQQAQQMKMMKWLPIMFAVILYNYTAALAIYMVLSSAVAIIESKIVRAKDEEDEAADAATAPA